MEKEVKFEDLHRIRQSIAQAGALTEEEDDSDENHSVLAFLYHRFRDFYVDNIPVDIVKELPNYLKYMVGAFCYFAALGIFIYFATINYESNVSQAFLSLSESSGSCTTVPIEITNTYLADNNGNWQGTPNFLYYQAPYQFQFSSFEVSSLDEYQLMMKIYFQSLSEYGGIATQHNLAINLVIWMSFIRFYSTENPYTLNFTSTGRGNLQYVELTGDPAVIFHSRFSGIALGSSAGVCNIPSMVTYDQANALFQAMVNGSLFQTSNICTDVTSPFVFKENKNLNPFFSIDLDVRSFTTALAVNLGFVDIQNLMIATGQILTVNYNSVSYAVGKYFDIRYPLMDSILCINNKSVIPSTSPQITHLCFVGAGSAFFLPVFNHAGNNFQYPEYCNCSTGIGKSTSCNEFYLMSGLVTFPLTTETSTFSTTASMQEIIKYSIQLLVQHNSDYWALNRAAYDASAASVFVTMNTSSRSVDSSYMKNAFNFCKLSSTVTCSLVTFFSLDQDNTVSDYHYPLYNGSCANSFQVEQSSWENLAINPPSPLYQIYYKCYPATFDAFLNAIGVASGNTSIAMLLLLFISVPSIFGFMACCRVIPREQEYKEKEKQVALDSLATVLLRVRDRHFEAIDENSTITNLTEELVKAVAYSNHQILLENSAEGKSGKFGPSYIPVAPDDISVHREFFGKVLIYRHMNKARLTQKAFQAREVDDRFVMRTFSSNRADLFNLGEDEEGVDEGKNDIEEARAVATRTTELEPDSLVRIRIMNLSEEEILYPVDDPSWQVPYHDANFPALIAGLVYYFSTAVRAQLAREKAGKILPSHLKLYQIDLDYAKGCILAKQLIKMNEQDLLQIKDPVIFVSLANALSMHASIENDLYSLDLNVDMHEISVSYADRIGYQIGDKIFTFSVLTAYTLRNPHSGLSL